MEQQMVDDKQSTLEDNTIATNGDMCLCLEDYKRQLVEKKLLTNTGRWKLFGWIPWRYATILELRRLFIEETQWNWFQEPIYDVDNPDFNEQLYETYIESLLTKLGDPTCPLSITFKDIAVRVPVYTKPAINNMLLGLQKIITEPFLQLTRLVLPKSMLHKETHFILENVSGTILPGEMVLLLGPPESGKSTFLRALANQLDSNCESFGQFYYGDSLYTPQVEHLIRFVDQEDHHMASLTVRYVTCQFCKIIS